MVIPDDIMGGALSHDGATLQTVYHRRDEDANYRLTILIIPINCPGDTWPSMNCSRRMDA
jgi:hypothetical protein